MKKIDYHKTVVTITALVLMLNIAALLITATLPVIGQEPPPRTGAQTIASISVSPNPVQLGQYVLINAWVTPQPRWASDNNPASQIPGESVFADMYVDMIDPNGNVDTIGPMTSYSSGTIFFTYTPDALGEWTAILRFLGDIANIASTSPPYKFTVQQDPIPAFPEAPLPDGYWERPISGENREWYKISGAWTQTGRNEANSNGGCFNPYSRAPNSAHILWKKPFAGGLIGGTYESLSRTSVPSPVMMNGRAYYTRNDGLHCIDIRSGEELWDPPVDASGSVYLVPGPTPYLWMAGGSGGGDWRRYDPITGELTRTVNWDIEFRYPERRARLVVDDNGIFYWHSYNIAVQPRPPQIAGQVYRAFAWDSSVGGDYTDGLLWTVEFANDSSKRSLEHPYQVNGGIAVAEGKVWMNGNGGNTTTCIDAKTGQVLFNNLLNYWIQGFGCIEDGVGIAPSNWDRRAHGFSLATGQEIWQTDEQTEYPWGEFWPYQMGAAYGNFYAGSYDGHVRCIDSQTGHVEWKFYAGDSGAAAPYDSYPFYSNPAVADGKVYYANTEHSPTQPLIQGCRLYALNAYNGDELWSIAMMGNHLAIADGALIASDSYTAQLIAFDKGKTETTVETEAYVAKGEYTWISGTVMDLSPAQPNTPAVSKDIMSAWMEYLHMGKPAPDTTMGTGVLVKLIAEAKDGTIIEIGETTSTCDGVFSFKWTPPDEDFYKITAVFEGDDSYWSSYGIAGVAVGPEITPAGPIEPEPTEAPFITTEVAIIAAVAVAVVIGIVAYWTLRKRQ